MFVFVCVRVRAGARVCVCVRVSVGCACVVRVLCVCVLCVRYARARARVVARACVGLPTQTSFFALSHLTRFRLRKNWHKPFITMKERIVKFRLHAGGDPVHLR